MAEQTQQLAEIKRPEKKGLDETRVVRILSTDIEGKMQVYPGLTKIKGVSWSMSNATCRILDIDKRKKIGALSETELKKITESFSIFWQIPWYFSIYTYNIISGHCGYQNYILIFCMIHVLSSCQNRTGKICQPNFDHARDEIVSSFLRV